MKLYRGNPPHDVFIVAAQTQLHRRLPLRLDLENHSPTGFSWGYGGSGPAQLALALLADAIDDNTARRHYQEFKSGIIARLPGDLPWEMAEDEIKDAVLMLEGRRSFAESKRGLD